MTLALARNAQDILAARLRGFKPDEMVMVSLGAPLYTANKVVFATLDTEYDWRWVRGLDIGVWIGDEPNWVPIVKAIALQCPDYLCVWHSSQRWGAQVHLFPVLADVESKPARLWGWDLVFSEWLDFQNRDFIEGRTYDGRK